MQKYFIVLSFNMVYVAGSIEWSKMFAVERVRTRTQIHPEITLNE